MARPATSDLFHSFRFFASASDIGVIKPLEVAGAQAGFSSITTPEYTLEAVEYREGNSTFTKKFPGLPTTADLTFSRGVVKNDTGFYDWLIATMASGGDYRTDITIWQFHRAGLPIWSPPVSMNNLPLQQVETNNVTAPLRKYQVFEAFPIRVKPAGDLDASTADVSVAEADVAYEYFIIQDSG